MTNDAEARTPSPEELTEPFEGAEYPTAGMFCDIVMKGGVTSGVVYPLAICAIAQKYVFRNIGGTSAGAIASALAAAAEYSRRSGKGTGTGFRGLARLPVFLAKDNGLLNLFQPSKKTKPLFKTLLQATKGEDLWRLCCVASFSYWRWVIGPLAIVAACAILICSGLASRPLQLFAIVLAIVFAVLAALLGIALGVWKTIRVNVPQNLFGMCTGLDQEPGKPLPLTTWLDSQINTYAGVSGPLTFGQLWSAEAPWAPNGKMPVYDPTGNSYLDELAAREARSINLEMVTTNATIGRPYRLPFSKLNEFVYYFDPDELKRLFPPKVVAHLIQCGDKNFPKLQYAPAGAKVVPILPLPSAADFPVVVAARMSLSFPILFSAIPLYAVPRKGCAEAGSTAITKCWFSDGGISSNLPIHFFDNPLPRWPTFALNLRNPAGDVNPAMADKYPPDINIISDSGPSQLPSFLLAVVDSMQNWNDNMLLQLPGYKERVVEVQLDASEGGLNLAMDAAKIMRLMINGAAAGKLLVEQFAPLALNAPEPTRRWDEHRVTRLRSTLTMINELMRSLHGGVAGNIAPDNAYREMATGQMEPYPWASTEQQQAGIRLLYALDRIGSYLARKPPLNDPMHTAPVPGPGLNPRGRQ